MEKNYIKGPLLIRPKSSAHKTHLNVFVYWHRDRLAIKTPYCRSRGWFY